MKNNTRDKFDKEILRMLQHDCTVPISEIAEQVGLSTTPCWRRIQRLEQEGVIKQRVALLEPAALELGMTVFVQVKAGQHDAAWLTKFARHAATMQEVVEFYRMSGEYDYLLKVMVEDMSAFDLFYKKLVGGINLTDVTSSFAMEQIKYTTALPLP